MSTPAERSHSIDVHAGRAGVSRAVWHTIGLVLAALLAYAIWRGYQNPDLLLDLSAFRIC
ncbi:MAG: hypothetical protein GZ089_09860 [Aromatoleum sp.]|nr:hypothetical protein [Aromatoleum sp.]